MPPRCMHMSASQSVVSATIRISYMWLKMILFSTIALAAIPSARSQPYISSAGCSDIRWHLQYFRGLCWRVLLSRCCLPWGLRPCCCSCSGPKGCVQFCCLPAFHPSPSGCRKFQRYLLTVGLLHLLWLAWNLRRMQCHKLTGILWAHSLSTNLRTPSRREALLKTGTRRTGMHGPSAKLKTKEQTKQTWQMISARAT
jgi:hypothetical protein